MIQRASSQLASKYVEAERELLLILNRGDITSWKRAFTQQQIAQIRQILEELNGVTESWATHHIPTLYEYGLSVADNALQPGGLSVAAHPGEITPMDLSMNKLHTEAIQIMQENMTFRMGEANNHVGQRLTDMIARARLNSIEEQIAIRDTTLNTMQQAIMQGKTREEAGNAFLKDLKQNGITEFVDKSGRQWNMKAYCEIVTRPSGREAVTHATLNRTRELGGDLMQVSEHSGACELCAPWEGEILSITGETAGYPTIADAEAAGLHHPNCAHVLMPYFSEYAA
jgi:hypothetical protein